MIPYLLTLLIYKCVKAFVLYDTFGLPYKYFNIAYNQTNVGLILK